MVSCFKGAFRVTSPFGERILNGKKENHKGIDLVGVENTAVYAVSDGVVRTGIQANGAGNYVVVTVPDGRRVYYMHLKSFSVKNGQSVRKGDELGMMGNTGNSFGAHTHLELRPMGTGSECLDVCDYTGIPNRIGTYVYNPNEREEEKKEAEEEEDESMTQETFNRLMDGYLAERAKKAASGWSEKERAYCEANGIIKGDGNGSFSYQSFLTREEMAVIAYRLAGGGTASAGA